MFATGTGGVFVRLDEGVNVGASWRKVWAVGCVLLLGACAQSTMDRPGSPGPSAGGPRCEFPEPLQLLGMPPDAKLFRIHAGDEQYLNRRCGQFRSVARSLYALEMAGHPVGVWQGDRRPLTIAVRLRISGISDGPQLAPQARGEIRKLGREALAGQRRPLVVLGTSERARKVADQLVAAGVERDRVYVNAGQIPAFRGALGPARDGDPDAVAVIEFETERGLVRYAGGMPGMDVPRPASKPATRTARDRTAGEGARREADRKSVV